MDKNSVLTKSDPGRDAIARRLPELPARLRPLLIMVDGKRSVAELEKVAELVGGWSAIEQLLALGMVEAVSGGQSPPGEASAAVTTPSAASPAPGASDSLTLPEFCGQLADYFEAQLGHSATMLAIQIRACTKLSDLKPLVARGLDNLKHFKGAVAVKEYEQGLGSQMPKA